MKNIALMLALLILVPKSVYASEPQIAIITRQGAPTPFPGVLLTNEEYARLIAEREAIVEKEKNKCMLDKALDINGLKLTTSTLSIALESQKKLSDDIISNRDKTIAEQDEKIIKLSEDKSLTDGQKLLWMGLGVVIVLGSAASLKLIEKHVE